MGVKILPLLSLLPLLLFFAFFAVVGCVRETELDDMEIKKIETSWQEGLAPFAGYYLRTFDFKKGKVYDTLVTEEDVSAILEHTNGFTADDFNTPKQVATFTQEQAIDLFENIKLLGFFDWEEEYITDDIIDDGGSSRVTVYFADGTVKSTRIYFKYPPNYDNIRNAFEQYFGVAFYNGW